MAEEILSVQSLNVERGGETVIDSASFSIGRGEFVGMVGPNGGGKTTLILGLLGLLPAKSGSIRLFGTRPDEFTEWDKIAYVSQSAIHFDENFPLTVKELVGLGRVSKTNLGRRLGTSDWEAVNEALHIMGIEKLSNKRIGELSGGQKQRVFVAKALVRHPELLLLDEPVAGMDADALERFYQKLSNLNSEKGITILIVSHDLAAVFCRMSRVICVNKRVHESVISPDTDPNSILKETYGEHFHFVFHEHSCKGVMEDE